MFHRSSAYFKPPEYVVQEGAFLKLLYTDISSSRGRLLEFRVVKELPNDENYKAQFLESTKKLVFPLSVEFFEGVQYIVACRYFV